MRFKLACDALIISQTAFINMCSPQQSQTKKPRAAAQSYSGRGLTCSFCCPECCLYDSEAEHRRTKESVIFMRHSVRAGLTIYLLNGALHMFESEIYMNNGLKWGNGVGLGDK